MPIRKTDIPAIIVLASVFETTNQAKTRNTRGPMIRFNIELTS
jgi:hypothetical protein